MNIKFFGAAQCVTGSCHLLTIKDVKILLDCGMFQGKDEKENDNSQFFFNPEEVDYVILSHAHLDHCGRIPLLLKKGFKGVIISTPATKDLYDYILKDFAYSNMEDIYFKNLKRQKLKQEPLNSLFEKSHVDQSLDCFKCYQYGEEITLTPEIKVILKDAGHILGSALCEIWVKSNRGIYKKIVYSGDVGNKHRYILKDPEKVEKGDVLIMECTYGDKIHKDPPSNDKLLNVINKTLKNHGNIIIPSFSLGRTQEIIYILNDFIENNKLVNCKVYIDSPLATDITKLFKKYQSYFDEEAKKLIGEGDYPLEFKGLEFVTDRERSKELNSIKSGAIIIASSGMCEGGRIMFHLKENLNRIESTVIFTCHQSMGTLGHEIISGAKKVSILGEEVDIKCKIEVLEGLSGHGDKIQLEGWLSQFKMCPEKVFLVHGEKKVLENFANELMDKGYNAFYPSMKEEFILED